MAGKKTQNAEGGKEEAGKELARKNKWERSWLEQ
jgi:hypothetical protein